MLYIFVFIFGTSLTLVRGYIEISNLPNTWPVSVHESETDVPLFLYSVRVYSPDVTMTCTLVTSTFSPDFTITDAGNYNWDIKLKSSTTLDESTNPSINLSVSCGDTSNQKTGILTVTVIENVKPVFTDLTPEVDISAQTTRVGQVIYTFEFTDPDSSSSSLTYAIVPPSSVFNISGESLVLSTDLSKTKTTSYSVTVEVRDEELGNQQSIPVTINVNDINAIPEFIKTSDTKAFPEMTKGRKLLYTIGHSDGNGDDVQITYVTTNTNNDLFFDLVPSTGEVYLLDGMEFNYETVSSYTLAVQIEDWLEMQSTQFILTIQVTDVPEGPWWTDVPATLTKDEASKGVLVGQLSSFCDDFDNMPPDNITYAILFSAESAYFAIDNYSGIVTFAQDFDYDDPNLANALNLTIRCSDINGFSADTFLQVIVNDVNDNAPICAPKPKSLSLRYDQQVNTPLSFLDCTDKDSTVNAELDYNIIGLAKGYSKTYFQVDSGGNVSISKTFAMDFNTSFFVTIKVKDRGTPSLSITVTLTITYTEKPWNITYTKVDECFICTTSAISLLAALGLFALSVTICLLYLLILKCAYDIERRKMAKAFAKKEKR
ncbi:hypothetical protein DPMN_118167, partial [Dreissena polymorpha]